MKNLSLRDRLRDYIFKFLRFKKGVEVTGEGDDLKFSEHFVTPFDIVELTFLIEDKFGIEIESSVIVNVKTVGEYIDRVLREVKDVEHV